MAVVKVPVPLPSPTKRQADDDIRNEMGGVEAFLSPFYRRTPKNDPLAKGFLDDGASLGSRGKSSWTVKARNVG